jgi:hypothetical protein
MVEPEVQITLNSENTDPEQQVAIKSKRRQLRARITRSIKRIREFIEQNNHNKTRFDKEMAELRRDFERAREFHTQLYDFADESQLPTMDKWENDLTNDVYSIEEETELYLSTISLPEASQTSQIQFKVPRKICKVCRLPLSLRLNLRLCQVLKITQQTK